MRRNVISVATAAECLRALAVLENVMLLVTDLRLGGKSGAELAVCVRKLDGSRALPILILSGVEENDPALLEVMALPSVRFLQKPYGVRALRGLVEATAGYV